jgi:hypothetical protein
LRSLSWSAVMSALPFSSTGLFPVYWFYRSLTAVQVTKLPEVRPSKNLEAGRYLTDSA